MIAATAPAAAAACCLTANVQPPRRTSTTVPASQPCVGSSGGTASRPVTPPTGVFGVYSAMCMVTAVPPTTNRSASGAE
jgi:hypothetical protein